MTRRQMIGLTVPAVVAGAIPGCVTMQHQATPARIEAVAALAAYYSGKQIVDSGSGDDLRATVAALQSIAAAKKIDLAAVASALSASGVAWVGTDEGALTFGAAAILFSDFWAGSAEKVLDDPRARAAVNGLVRGFELALRMGGKAARTALIHVADLRDEVVATRPGR